MHMVSLIRRRAVALAAVAGLCLALGSIAVPAAQAEPVTPVQAWGSNSSGQLGNGTMTSSTTPVSASIAAGTLVTAVSAGGHHSLALTDDGTVLAWGNNHFGQLGIGNHQNKTTPVTVPLPAGTDVTAISAGYDYSLALTSTGSIYAWGLGGAGQLGDGSLTNSLSPVLVNLPNGTTATAISAGDRHALAVTNSGGVMSWGENAYGQLGDGSTTTSDAPVNVSLPGGTTVTAVAAGGAHSLALA
jgi:alpha-tubulin suppressor-like RCC1 family protein